MLKSILYLVVLWFDFTSTLKTTTEYQIKQPVPIKPPSTDDYKLITPDLKSLPKPTKKKKKTKKKKVIKPKSKIDIALLTRDNRCVQLCNNKSPLIATNSQKLLACLKTCQP